MKKLKQYFPLLIVGLFSANLLWLCKTPAPRGLNVEGFSRLPVLEGGRMKPLDTVARSSLLLLSGKQTLHLPKGSLSADQWLMDMIARPTVADGYPVFVIDDPDLKTRIVQQTAHGKYFYFQELKPFLKEFDEQSRQASQLPEGQRSLFQTAVVRLQERLEIYQRLKNTFMVEQTEDMPAELELYSKKLEAGIQAIHKHLKSTSFDKKPLEQLTPYFEKYQFLAQAAYFRPIPPYEGEKPEDWLSVGEGLLESLRAGTYHPVILTYATLIRAYQGSDAENFNRILNGYRLWLDSSAPKAAKKANYEFEFNRIEPFYQGMILYAAAFLLAFLSWLFWPETFSRASLWVLVLAFFVHTLGLVFRIVLQGRPPVTNLYSSAIFVGWAAVLLGIITEKFSKKGFGVVAASVMGFSTLIIAHHLTGQGDTMEMMRAVLDSNFWLATHVVAVTIGYSSTFLASVLAQVYIFRGLFTRSLDKDTAKSLSSMTYGVICFSLFFSFVGTVLGGIWADQSWGRFWGWDPKENGALLIVLWNAIILHARWGGYVRERGVQVLAVFGGIITSLSWFGVNMLGIGLHSYGFMEKTFYVLMIFISSQLAVIALGSLPLEYWASFSSRPKNR